MEIRKTVSLKGEAMGGKKNHVMFQNVFSCKKNIQ
jgi:hypothetical protein